MAKTYQEMVDEARTRISEVEPAALKAELDAGEEVAIVDVREHEDWRTEHISGSIPIARGILESRISKELPAHEQAIVVHCGGGGRGVLAADTLQAMGYKNVRALQGGLRAWKAAGFETASSTGTQ